ncbi:MAG: aldo/keto reductase [Planctomycetes bacterium]|nr:aldo/keto reductase [Planctomycetota bacterium]
MPLLAPRSFGPLPMPVATLGQGTWNMEGAREDSIAALRRGLDLGMTHIDTAELYGKGLVEELVGEAIAGRREQVFLVSKVQPSNASHKGTLEACERSLKRLRTDRIDVYLLHWPSAHPLEGTIRAFESLVKSGKIRAWGLSNFDVLDLEKAFRIAGPDRIACNQVLYHLKDRAIEHAVAPWCERHGIAVVAYSPFGHSDFPAPATPEGRALGTIASAKGATPRQVALAWLTRRPSTFAIPKASSVAHVEENARAAKLVLTPVEVAAIEKVFPVGAKRALPRL